MPEAQVLTHPKPHVLEIPKIRHFPIKRIFDLGFSAIVLVLGCPLFLLIASSITLTSPGAPIYTQTRIGRGGRPFRCYKFRSMFVDADERLEQVLRKSPSLCREWQTSRKLRRDPRVTSIGRFLRKTSLDELPQFLNVLKGDLSVVGPRPVVLEEVQECMGVRAKKILSIRPGITGLWQVSGRNDTSYDQRLNLEERYVDSRSFWLDVKIILKTLPAMISSRGAY